MIFRIIKNHNLFLQPSYVLTQKRFTTNGPLKPNAVVALMQTKNPSSVPVNYTPIYHKMTPIYNPNTLGHIQLYNKDPYMAAANEQAISVAKKVKTYKPINDLYTDNQYNISAKTFDQIVAINGCTRFHTLYEMHNIRTTLYNKAFEPFYKTQPEPDNVLHFDKFPLSSKWKFRKLGIDQKLKQAAFDPSRPDYQITSLYFSNISNEKYSRNLEETEKLYMFKYKKLIPELAEFFEQFRACSDEKQLLLFYKYIKYLDPEIIPSFRSQEIFYKKVLKPRYLDELIRQEEINQKISERLFATKTLQQSTSKEGLLFFNENPSLCKDLF